MVAILHHRKSIRLKGYDYSKAGRYFITVCTQNRLHYFGEIVGATLRGRPNNPDAMIETWLLELEHKFNDVKIGPYVIMPNHIHVIIEKENAGSVADQNRGGQWGDHAGSPLRNVIGWFKTMTTNEYMRKVREGLYEPFEKRLWQRNYYEHIIRDEQDYQTIAEYIEQNPMRWEQDVLYEEIEMGQEAK